MKRYPEYRDSGVEWLGKIPVGWRSVKVKFTDNLIMGQSPESKDVTDYENGFPFLQGNAEFTGSHPIAVNWCVRPNKLAHKDDLLLSVRAPVGALNVADQFYGIGRGLCAIRAKKNLSRFLFYLLSISKEELNKVATGTTFTAVSVNSLSNIFIPQVPHADQETIIRFLDHKTRQIDQFIANRQRQIELLKEQKAALINRAVTKGIDPDAKMKDSEVEWIGDVPQHWTVMELKFAARMMRGKFSHRPRNDQRLYGGKYPFIQTGDVTKTDKYITGFSQTLNDWGYSVSKEFPKGTVVITIAANVGDIAILDFDACFPDSVVGFYSNLNSSEYLFYLMKAMKEVFLSESIEGTQLNLSVDRLSAIKVAIPKPQEQKQILDLIEAETLKLDNLVSKYQKQIGLMQEYRTALISQAVTGKIDVRGWGPKKKKTDSESNKTHEKRN
jgi:type I restriction enzyme, S subunit